MNYFLVSPSYDGYENLARDEFLLNSIRPGCIALYLYVNGNAVIIGRNQNPYIECNLNRLDADGVQLVRRVSGGGAVYHDRGNLNYSFIASSDIYDEARQTGVILKALSSFGIEAEVSGRNDITASGLKFSGNAFSARGNNRQHHGTLLISSDLTVFSNYLTPSKQKLAAKGIKSVRARVCNLSEINPAVTVESMKKALEAAFIAEYGEAHGYPFTDEDEAEVKRLYEKHASWAWRMGETPHFDIQLDNRFSWGMTNLLLSVESGLVTKAQVYSDSLDTDLPARLTKMLTGLKYEKNALVTSLLVMGKEGTELSEYIAQTDI